MTPDTTGSPVTLEVASGVARLTLNRPAQGNAMDPPLCAALRAHAESLLERTDVRVVILSGAGKRFCVGGDLGYFADSDNVERALFDLATDLHGAVDALARLDAPVIAAVQGSAAGAGLSLVCGSDFAIGTAGSKYTMAYTAAGLSPDGGSTWYLPRIVGWRVAAEMMITNRMLTAPEARELGILGSVVDDDALIGEADALAERLATGPTGAYGSVKRLLRASTDATLAEQLAAEAKAIAANAGSPDGREGVAAFLAKRRPQFGDHR